VCVCVCMCARASLLADDFKLTGMVVSVNGCVNIHSVSLQPPTCDRMAQLAQNSSSRMTPLFINSKAQIDETNSLRETLIRNLEFFHRLLMIRMKQITFKFLLQL